MAKRIVGLDQLRFILALWVLLSHSQLVPDLSGRPYASLVELVFRGVVNNLVNPVAAVIVFFIISGFCIHLPYRNQASLPLSSYFTRRFVRILIPMLAAFLLAIPLQVGFAIFSDSILWSLLCEEIYYLLYPLLRSLAARSSWQRLFQISFGVGLVIGMARLTQTLVQQNDSSHGIYPAYGAWLTWLLGLPCWLLGCMLAQQLDKLTYWLSVTTREIWLWRTGVWFISFICSVLKFHSPFGYPLTLNLFAVLAYFWLKREIAYHQTHAPSKVLEKAGVCSYSMYLVHLHAQSLYSLIAFPAMLGPVRWILHLTFILCACYIFYLLVEKPSHRLARELSSRLNTLAIPALSG